MEIKNGREIAYLASPIIMTMFSSTLMWTADTILLGHYSSLALAASGLGGLITWASYSLFNNLSRISNTFIAQAFGRNDNKAVGDYAWQVAYIAIVGGIILSLMGYFSNHVLPFTKNPPEVIDQTYLYIKWRTLSAVFTQLSFCLMGYFQGRKRTRVPMWAGIISNSVNVIIDIWLIFGWAGFEFAGKTWLAVPEMGVTGAAIGTSVATFLNFLIMAAWAIFPAYGRKHYKIHVPRKIDFKIIKKAFVVGMPASMSGFIDMVGFAIFTILIGRAGAVALATSQIQVQILSFSFMPMWGLTIAGSVLMGNHVGQGDHDKAAMYGRQTYKMGLYYSLSLAVILVLLGGSIYKIFTPDPAILAFAATMVPLAALFQVFDGARMIGNGLLTGAGDTKPAMLIAFFIGWLVFLPLTWYLVVYHNGSVAVAWIGSVVCYAIRSVLLYGRFLSGKWRHVDLWK